MLLLHKWPENSADMACDFHGYILVPSFNFNPGSGIEYIVSLIDLIHNNTVSEHCSWQFFIVKIMKYFPNQNQGCVVKLCLTG